MNILFLIGNGFDLNVGLNTRFKDVLESYLSEENKDPCIIKFKKNISENFENWSDFEKQMGIYTEEYDSTTIEYYCFCVKNFKESLIRHLKKEEDRIAFDAKKDKIVDVLKRSIYSFYDELQLNSKDILARPILRARSQHDYPLYNFITFNYTHVLDKCLDNIKASRSDIGNILHIHGTVSKNPIMGIDNINQIVNKELLTNDKLARVIIKPVVNKKLKYLNDIEGKNTINSSDIICLFGLSLGETDQTWWEIIGNWLKISAGRQLVIFDIANQWNAIHADEEIENIDAIEEKFCSAAGFSEKERESVASRIHIGLNTDMFKIDLTK